MNASFTPHTRTETKSSDIGDELKNIPATCQQHCKYQINSNH